MKPPTPVIRPPRSLRLAIAAWAGRWLFLGASWLLLEVLAFAAVASSGTPEAPPATWPQPYTVKRDRAAGTLTLRTPYYVVEQDLRKGGVISRIQLTYGAASNLLVSPIETRVVTEAGAVFSEANDPRPRFSRRRVGLTEIVSVESRLLDRQGRAADLRLKTVIEYHWGYLKVHKEFLTRSGAVRVRELSPVTTVLAPSLTDYGYREGITEEEGAPPFAFGSNRWGKFRPQSPADPPLNLRYPPRSMIFAAPGIEGVEWFVGSDLAQWDLQLTGRRGQGRCVLERSQDPAGLALTIAPLALGEGAISLPERVAFDFYFGIPIRTGQAAKPWLHTSFNRNRGAWVAPEQVRSWQESGIQTVHCHNDGDYYDDGLFWRDGSYPPYPDMDRYDQVIRQCHEAGIRVATYFSNKELHPSTPEFQAHGTAWGRNDRQGKLQHNFFKEKSEFGVQMCLRSGWLDFLKLSIDRVLDRHALDGVYYDWNVALLCQNPRHEGKPPGAVASGHWDIDELLKFMEWSRQRVGPRGVIIVHNTTTPMFAMENFADYVVANEWGYGKWTDKAPDLAALPLEWSLVGARPRGVISYGQLDSQSLRRLHRLFALQALLSGVTPWPASPEAFELASLLKPLGDLGSYRFADWRNQAVTIDGGRGAAAIYSQPGKCYVLVANLEAVPRELRCAVRLEKLPCPLAGPRTATLLSGTAPGKPEPTTDRPRNLDLGPLTRDGVNLPIPADSAVLLEIR